MTGAIFVGFLARAIKYASVFIFGSTGETITEKSGHLNMGLPGIMYLGALGGILGERIYLDAVGAEGSLNGFMVLFMPMLFAMLFAAIGGLLFSFFTVTLKCNHNVTGLTITTFGVGISCYFIGLIPSDRMSEAGLMVQSLFPVASDDWFSTIFLQQSLFTYLAIIIAIVAAVFLSKTRIGLNLRACGENPAAADAAGINVDQYRYLATLIGSAIAGLGGMVLEIDLLMGMFNPKDAVDSFGWLALSLVIFSMWKPSVCIFASLLFGGLLVLPNFSNFTSAEKLVFAMVPYLATIVILILTSVFNKKNAQPPAGLGITYFREDR